VYQYAPLEVTLQIIVVTVSSCEFQFHTKLLKFTFVYSTKVYFCIFNFQEKAYSLDGRVADASVASEKANALQAAYFH
jgi:hypothetical protein